MRHRLNAVEEDKYYQETQLTQSSPSLSSTHCLGNMDRHNEVVATIAARARHLYAGKIPWRVYHGSTHSTRKTAHTSNNIIDTSDLTHILSIDPLSKTALVEPNVTMESLVKQTLPHLLPPVVPEFPAITIGGALAGTAAESSSFRHGFVADTISWIQVVLPTGEVVGASRENNQDLFHGVAGSFGTLGVVTLVKLELMEAKSFVELTYHLVRGIDDAIAATRDACADSLNDYVDGIAFSKSRGVVITARFVDSLGAGANVQTFAQAHDEWFYLHVESILNHEIASRHSRSHEKVDYHKEIMPIQDYLFRYDRGAFWTGRHVFTYFSLPFTYPLRCLFDPLLRAKVMYHGLHESGMAKDNFIQDVVIPVSQVSKFVAWIDDNFGVWPLWICPLRRDVEGTNKSMNPYASSAAVTAHPDYASKERLSLSETSNDEEESANLMMNIGIWGPRLPDPSDYVNQNRRLEHQVRAVGGMKWLYAHCHYSENEFWALYDKPRYDALRSKYHASHLPTVYDKVRFDFDAEERVMRASWLRWLAGFVWWVWPVPGIWCLVCVFNGSDYVRSA